MIRLVDRNPRLTARELAERLVPPKRFAGVRFESYVPNPDHPSQAEALGAVAEFSRSLGEGASERGWFRKRDRGSERRPGRYLDGGYGVGKTHLLASLWHAAPSPKAYVTFEELTALIGFEGMDAALRTFRGSSVLCIDEFELDDVANTRMAVTFLRSVIAGGTKIAATSNAIPDRLGEGRFNAEDFQREISAIAAHFEVIRIDGPDYRGLHGRSRQAALDAGAIEALANASPSRERASLDDFDEVLAHLRKVHPVQFRALIDDVDTVLLRGMHPIENQGSALLFVQLVDELYDAEVTFGATGCSVDELFPETYRHGGFRKKYGRCESRLAAMLGESGSE